MIKCNYSHIDFEDSSTNGKFMICENEAKFSTCDPIGGVVCELHKCRCSKLLTQTQLDEHETKQLLKS